MKKILVLLPLLLIAVLVLTWCDSNKVSESDTTIARLESELSQSIERNNMLTSELRAKGTEESAEWDDTMILELSKEATKEQVTAPKTKAITNLTFGNQPTKAPGEYSANTTQLNAYAHNNMVWLSVPAWANTMTINLKKDVIDNGRNIIVYVETKGRHCGWRILWAELWEVKWSTFTFDLTNMWAYPTVCWGDWSSKIDWKEIAIWWYVTTYDGNWINSISFN